MIYQNQAHLPITYVQLHFRHLSNELSPALRVLTQRQVLRGTRRSNRECFINEVESLGTELVLTHRRYAHSIGGVVLSRTLPQLVRLLDEAINEPRLDQDELAQSKRAYIAELEARYDDDHAMAWLWLARRLHAQHPLWEDYAVDHADIEAVSIELVREAWSHTFHPEVMLPCVTSDRSQEEILEALSILQRPSPRNMINTRELDHRSSILAPLSQSTLTLIHKPNKRQATIFIAHPTLNSNHPQALALEVALCALGGTFSSPLMQEVRVKRSLSYGAFAGLKGEANARFICLNATPDAKDAVETLEVMLSVLDRGAQGELSDEAFLFARDYLINAHPFSIETPAMRAGLSANATLLGLDPKRFLETPTLLKPLSAAEIRQAAIDHISMKHLEVLIYADQEAELRGAIDKLKSLFPFDRVLSVSSNADAEELRDRTRES